MRARYGEGPTGQVPKIDRTARPGEDAPDAGGNTVQLKAKKNRPYRRSHLEPFGAVGIGYRVVRKSVGGHYEDCFIPGNRRAA